MNQGSHSKTPIVFGLIIVLSGRLVTKGKTASCEFEIESGKPKITVMCQFPPNTTKSDIFSVYKIERENTLLIDYDGNGTILYTDSSKYNVTFNPPNVTVWITNASKTDTGTYECDMPHLNFKSRCNLTKKQIDDLKNCTVVGVQLTSTSASTSDSSSVSVSGHHRFNSTAPVFASSTSDNNASTDSLKAADAGGEAGVGAGVLAGVLLLVSAVTVFICRRRRRENKNRPCHHSASIQSQTSQKYVYSSVPSDVENGGVRHVEESKREDMILSEEVQRLAENNECRQADEQVLNSVIEIMKGFANSPGCSDTTDKAAMKTNIKTKLMYRRGADVFLELSIENRVCSPDTFSEKESAIAGQEADRLESPLKTCTLTHRDMDLKTSIDVQEQANTDAHDVARNSDSDNQELKQTDSKIVDSKRASVIRLEDVPEKHSLSQTSFPCEKLQSSHCFADDTHDLTGKAEHNQESPEASKMIHEQCQCLGNTQHPFEADTTPDMPLSLLTAEKKYFQNKLEPDDIAEAESTSRVENIKVRPACV